MGDHSRTNAFAPMRENPEHRAVQADQSNEPEALVGVSGAEDRGRKENSGRNALRQGYELPLQVASKDSLLANTRRNRERNPYC